MRRKHLTTWSEPMASRFPAARAALCAALALTLLPAPLRAQEAASGGRDCTASPAPLPPDLASWSARGSAQAARDAAGLSGARLAIGGAVDAALLPTGDVHYVTRPEKPGGSVSYGGLFAFDVTGAGTYRVALGSGAWVDVLRDGKPVASSAHGHGPACSTVRKMVDFPLKPGRYVLQVAANGEATLPILVTRAP